jgi:hypothetical protein
MAQRFCVSIVLVPDQVAHIQRVFPGILVGVRVIGRMKPPPPNVLVGEGNKWVSRRSEDDAVETVIET